MGSIKAQMDENNAHKSMYKGKAHLGNPITDYVK